MKSLIDEFEYAPVQMTQPLQTLYKFFIPISLRFPIIVQYLGATGGQVFSLGSQLVTFVLLARSLGEIQFGQLMAITATTQIAMGLCGLGATEPLLRRVVRDKSAYPELLGHNLILLASTGIVLTLMCTVGLYFTVPLPLPFHQRLIVILIFSFSNIILYQYFVLTEMIFLARREFLRASSIVAAFAIARTLAAFIATYIFNVDTLVSWALWHGATYMLGVLGCALILHPLGAPRWQIVRDEIPRGIDIIIPNFLNTVRQNIDTLVLNTMTNPVVVANYAAASRIVQAGLLTVWSFTKITYPRLIEAGARGGAPVLRLSISLVIVAAILGGLNSIGLFLLSPYIANTFGKGFIHMAAYLKILSWLVLLSAIQSIANDALGAIEKHRQRGLILNACSILGAGLVVVLTYVYGVNGTFVAVYFAQLCALAALWLLLLYLGRREVVCLPNAGGR